VSRGLLRVIVPLAPPFMLSLARASKAAAPWFLWAHALHPAGWAVSLALPMNADPAVTAAAAARAQIEAEIILDGRLALYHQGENWLAVADVHFGYELSQRARGALFPLWGMAEIEERLGGLLADYDPQRLIVVGDFVHDRAARAPALALLARLNQRRAAAFEVVLIAGNHDRRAFAADEVCASHATAKFYFHHGDGPPPEDLGVRTAIVGHHHPAGMLRDGAGLALKLPAFVQNGREWILPAFSPWAAGGCADFGPAARLWLCSPGRILGPRI
jgi:putative SbcD/Mre11-related phosphoesterase